MNNNQRSTKIKYGSTGRALKAAILIFSAWMLLVSCRTGSTESNPTGFSKIEDEEYDVFSAIVREKYIGERTQLVTIGDDCEFFYVFEGAEEEDSILTGVFKTGNTLHLGMGRKLYINEIGFDTLSDFEEKIMHRGALEYKFNLNVRYLLINSDILDWKKVEEEKRDFWAEHYSLYPGSGGIISFSRAGFNHKKNRALVYFSLTHRNLWGYSQLAYLEKFNGTWEIKKLLTISVS